MKFEPFTKVEQVEEFFGRSIYKGGKEMTVVGASLSENKILYIQAVYENGTEVSMSAMNWFYSAKYMGHQFGKQMKGIENDF